MSGPGSRLASALGLPAAMLVFLGCGDGSGGWGGDEDSLSGSDPGVTRDHGVDGRDGGADARPGDLEQVLPAFRERFRPVDLAPYETHWVGFMGDADAWTRSYANYLESDWTTPGGAGSTSVGYARTYGVAFGLLDGKCVTYVAQYQSFFVDTDTSCYEDSVYVLYDCALRDGYYLDLKVISSGVINQGYEEFGHEEDRLYPAEVGWQTTMLLGQAADGTTALYPLAFGMNEDPGDACAF